MKKSLILLLALCGILLSQEAINITFTPEGVEAFVGNTEAVSNDPLNNQSSSQNTNNADNLQTGNNQNLTTSMGMSADITENNQSISIPFSLSFDEYLVDVSVPYHLSRKIVYAAGTKETSGFGDISVGVGYRKEFSKIYYQGNFSIKLPTGDENEQVDGYLVPLGTGTTDFYISGKASKYIGKRFSFHTSLNYRINGEGERDAKIKHFNEDGTEKGVETINYKIKNGNVFTASFLTKYQILNDFSLNANFIFSNFGEGSRDETRTYSWNEISEDTSSISNNQDMTSFDFVAGISYNFGIEMTVGAKIPLYTKRNSENNEEDRSMGFIIEFSHPIF